MTKKRKQPTIEDVLSRPWCYYCERDFDDVKVLHNHQKAKHFKCSHCNKRMKTIGGLRVHLSQTHKLELDDVENAIPGRNRLDVEIFGTEGIPEDAIQIHNQLVTEKFYQQEAANRGQGMGGPGGNQHAGVVKKPKIETAEEIKQRLAEHKAKKAAEQAAQNSQGGTPVQQTASPANGVSQNSQVPPSVSPPPLSVIPPQQPYGSVPAGQPYHPQAARGPFPYQAGPPAHHVPGFGPPAAYGMPPPVAFSPPPQQHFAHHASPLYPPHVPYGPPPSLQGPHGPPPSVSPYHPNQQFTQPAVSASTPPPVSNGSPLNRSNGVSLPPGLPQRPAFDAPPVSRSQLHEMHHGQTMSPGNGHQPFVPPLPVHPQNSATQVPPANLATGVDELISSAQQAQTAQDVDPSHVLAGKTPVPLEDTSIPSTTAIPPATEVTSAPKSQQETKTTGKKAKQATRLVVTDLETSPEEKMARLSRHTFNRPAVAAA